jgi:thioredoxin reductase (NADPH)
VSAAGHPRRPRALTLYLREWCSLCEQMERALQPLVAAGSIELRRVDVETDRDLEERYGARIPVLVGEATELCSGRLTPGLYLELAGGAPGSRPEGAPVG